MYESWDPEYATQNGAKLLDELVPNWHTRIDWETLDMWSSCSCVAGQTLIALAHEAGLNDGYHYAMKLGRDDAGDDGYAIWLVNHGFLPMGTESEVVDEWRIRATERKAMVSA